MQEAVLELEINFNWPTLVELNERCMDVVESCLLVIFEWPAFLN